MKKYYYIIIAVLVLFNINTMFKLNSIEKSMDRNVQQIYDEQNNLRNEISMIYSNVDEKLKKQASIFDSYDVEFGDEFNTDNLTVPVNISVTPKENTESLTASVMINNEKQKMIKNETTFTASIDVYVFDPFEVKVVLESNGIEKVETIDKYTDMQNKYLLEVFADFIGNTNYSKGKYQYDGDIVTNFFESKNNSPKNISISKYINGTLINEEKVDMHGNPSTMYSIKGEVELSANDKFEVYINFQDKYGFNYKYIVLADEIDSEGNNLVSSRPEWTNGNMVEITDKNGKVLIENFKY